MEKLKFEPCTFSSTTHSASVKRSLSMARRTFCKFSASAVSLDGAADFLQVLRVRLKDSIVFVVVLYFIGGRERGSEPHAWMRATL